MDRWRSHNLPPYLIGQGLPGAESHRNLPSSPVFPCQKNGWSDPHSSRWLHSDRIADVVDNAAADNFPLFQSELQGGQARHDFHGVRFGGKSLRLNHNARSLRL